MWRKFAQRALLVFTALTAASRTLPWAAAALRRVATPQEAEEAVVAVVSVGGGPGCCMYGWSLFEHIVLERGSVEAEQEAANVHGYTTSKQSRLEVWDFVAEAWAPWCARVDRTLMGDTGR